MRVALLCRYSSEKVYTGMHIYNNRLIHHLSAFPDVEVHVVTVGEGTDGTGEGNLHLHTFRKGLLAYLDPLLAFRVRQAVARIDPDVVHAFSTGFFYSTVAASLRSAYPTVLTAYGIYAKEGEYYRSEEKKPSLPIRSIIDITNERWVVRVIPHIVVDSPTISDLVRTWTDSSIHVVPAGIEYAAVREMLRAQENSTEEPDIFLVNNLQRIKGMDILIRAIPAVRQAIPDVTVWIGGSGPQREELAALVESLGLESNVTFLGFVPEEEKYRCYQACKLVVVPSRWDCQPAALFEAAASGKPVIASDTSNPGIVQDGVTGCIFRSGDTAGLAERTIRLLSDADLRERMGRAAQENAGCYDWGVVAAKYLEIYRDAVTSFEGRRRSGS
ncbi:MAG: glycosyltransferase family 4 protein [Methanomicrobiaceae archaeon]|nr:glycosyltransferase family 4 protein [Methanomicrobiaceae archaeon]